MSLPFGNRIFDVQRSYGIKLLASIHILSAILYPEVRELSISFCLNPFHEFEILTMVVVSAFHQYRL